MARAKKSIDDKLTELEVAVADRQGAELEEFLKTTLRDRNNRVVAKAAKIAGQNLLFNLLPDLVDAYGRFIEDGSAKPDKNCFAKTAIVKALYELDYRDPTFYIDGLRYRQLEPVWGGRVDTAIDIRCTCAFGLTISSYLRTIIELVELLNDPEPSVRTAAVRAIGLLEPFQAEIALRLKALQGDDDAQVVGECFAVLLKIEPDYSPEFVASFLQHPNEAIQELAALALGESRLEEAFECLKSFWMENLIQEPLRTVLLRAIALQRHDAALEFLLSAIENEDAFTAIKAIEALAIHRHDSKLKQRVEQSVKRRNQAETTAVFEREWDT